MVRLRQVLNPLRVTRPAMRATNDIPPLSDRQRGIFCTPPRAVPRKDGEMGISDAPSGEKSGDFDPNRAAFGKKRPTLRRKRSLRVNELDGSQNRLTSLDVTANDELDKLNCADNELDGLDLFHIPALCNLNRSLNRQHTLNLRL